MNLDSIVRGFYASLFVGAASAVIWGFLAVSVVTLPGWVVPCVWAISFVMATARYQLEEG